MSHTKHFHPIPIPPVTSDPKSVVDAVKALTEGYETISRQRGTMGGWMVSFMDLVDMGVITEEKANEYLIRRKGV